VVSSSVAWSRTLRLGGVQYTSDFSLQPDLVTFPVPVVRGSVAVPSTVDLLVNGVRQFSRQVPAGPFQLQQIPVLTGSSNVQVVVRNPLGQETVQNLPFYTSGQLLKGGLTSYGGELGAVRENYGQFSNDYGIPAANGSIRRGITDNITVELHGEGAQRVGVFGTGVAIRAGDIGVVTAALAGSRNSSMGYLYSAGFQRQSGRFSLNLTRTQASSGYRDVADIAGDPGQKSLTQIGAGVSLGTLGFANVSYNRIRYRQGTLNLFDGVNVVAQPSAASVLTASYTVQLPRNISLFASAFRDFSAHDGFGMTVGLSMPLGKRTSIGSTVSRQGRDISGGLQANQSAVEIGDLGWNLNLNEGQVAQRQGELDYKASWGEPSLAIDQSAGISAFRLGLTGALVAAGGGVFPTNTINNSFAIVRSGRLPGITVYNENRPVGKTNASGRLIVPDLRPYENNSIALDPLNLPMDAQAGQLSRVVRPNDQSGVVVDFAISRGAAARLHFIDTGGKDLPLGSMVALSDGSSAAPVGFDALTYLTHLKAKNHVEVALPNGSYCSADFPFDAALGKIETIGPIPCH
jgi:outer membrane usher protein